MQFIQDLCKQLNMDRKDLFLFFKNLRNNYQNDYIINLFNNENYTINKLDINRIFRFLDYSGKL